VKVCVFAPKGVVLVIDFTDFRALSAHGGAAKKRRSAQLDLIFSLCEKRQWSNEEVEGCSGQKNNLRFLSLHCANLISNKLNTLKKNNRKVSLEDECVCVSV
jgi:hypothetical protein